METLDNTDYAFDLLKRFGPRKINDMSLVNASLRPSGASYREDLIAGKFHKNPSEEIDKLLEDNYGYLVYQEDTIKFLKDICGFSGSEADSLRRAIGKKDTDALMASLPGILDGYCKVSPKSREIAEQEAKEFIQIIQDSSEYQFGLNHSTGYSMIGYACVRARTYYPLEFTTAYLNRAKDDNDIKNGYKLAETLGININQVKFRYSKLEYSFDKESNSIYQGIEKIKYLNATLATRLEEIGMNNYDSFIDVIRDIAGFGNSRQLRVLIVCGYFSEFGKNKKLMKILELYKTLGDKINMSKEKVDVLKLPHSVFKNNCIKETEKQYNKIDSDSILRTCCDLIADEAFDIHEQVGLETELLGEVQICIPELTDQYCVVEDIKITTRQNLIYIHHVNTGHKMSLWLSNRELEVADPIRKFDLVRINSMTQRSLKGWKVVSRNISKQ